MFDASDEANSHHSAPTKAATTSNPPNNVPTDSPEATKAKATTPTATKAMPLTVLRFFSNCAFEYFAMAQW